MWQYLIFAAAGCSAVAAIALTALPQRSRIASVLRGEEVAQWRFSRGHWRRIHLDADGRRPFPAASVTNPLVTCSPAAVVEADDQLTNSERRSMAAVGRSLKRMNP